MLVPDCRSRGPCGGLPGDDGGVAVECGLGVAFGEYDGERVVKDLGGATARLVAVGEHGPGVAGDEPEAAGGVRHSLLREVSGERPGVWQVDVKQRGEAVPLLARSWWQGEQAGCLLQGIQQVAGLCAAQFDQV